jgi:hypothetical protein
MSTMSVERCGARPAGKQAVGTGTSSLPAANCRNRRRFVGTPPLSKSKAQAVVMPETLYLCTWERIITNQLDRHERWRCLGRSRRVWERYFTVWTGRKHVLMCPEEKGQRHADQPNCTLTAWSDSGIGAGYCTWLWKWQSHYDREASS